MFVVLILAWMVGDANGEAKRFDLEAEVWINAPALVFPDDRSYAVLFFSTETNREKTEKLIEKLEKVAKGKDYFVMLLSPEKEDAVRRFVRREKIELPVGAGSKSYRQFKIDQFPQLIILGRTINKTASWGTLSLDRVDSLIPAESSGGLVSGAFDESSSNDMLTRYAREDPDDDQRGRAVRLLRGRMPTSEFLEFCDALLAECDPAQGLYGKIEYQRHLADPSIIEKQPELSNSSLASWARRANPTDVRWTRLAEYEKALSEKTLDQMWADYKSSLTNDPVDLLIRREIAHNLETRSDKVGARSMLMRILPIETDQGVRLYIVGSMMDVCGPGDTEAADFLEAHLAHEEDIRVLRPFLRTTIRYLRTGE